MKEAAQVIIEEIPEYAVAAEKPTPKIPRLVAKSLPADGKQGDADFVKKARSKLGLSQIDFAHKLGVTRHTIWRYERGEPLVERSRMLIEQLLEKYQQSAEQIKSLTNKAGIREAEALVIEWLDCIDPDAFSDEFRKKLLLRAKRLNDSKTALIATLLQRPKGATREELCKATGWPVVSLSEYAKRAGLELQVISKRGKQKRYRSK